jgi:hypothetical protein
MPSSLLPFEDPTPLPVVGNIDNIDDPPPPPPSSSMLARYDIMAFNVANFLKPWCSTNDCASCGPACARVMASSAV